MLEFSTYVFVWNLLLPPGGGWDGETSTMSLRGEFREADWDPVAECWVPGQVFCQTGGAELQVPILCEECMENDPGWIDLDGVFEDCECAYPTYPYFLVLKIEGGHGPTNTVGETPHDDDPGQCPASPIPEGLLVGAGGDCCDDPVGVQRWSWSGVKGIYR